MRDPRILKRTRVGDAAAHRVYSSRASPCCETHRKSETLIIYFFTCVRFLQTPQGCSHLRLNTPATAGLIVTSALIIWKSLMIATGSESPVVVVLSGSMEPAFYRGDILFLYLAKRPTRLGEIVVFNVEVGLKRGVVASHVI